MSPHPLNLKHSPRPLFTCKMLLEKIHAVSEVTFFHFKVVCYYMQEIQTKTTADFSQLKLGCSISTFNFKKATDQYFPMVLFQVMMYKGVIPFESKRADHVNKGLID